MTINTSDPRLTAFVLGELSADEAQEVQTAIDQSAELQSEVAGIRQIVAQIEQAMSEEPLPKADGRRQTADGRREPAAVPPKRYRWLRPAAVTAAIVAVAASLLVAVLLPPIVQESAKLQNAVPIAAQDADFESMLSQRKPPTAITLDEQKRETETTISTHRLPNTALPSEPKPEQLQLREERLVVIESSGERLQEAVEIRGSAG
jgi:anti-sigma factor RsiW